MRLSATRMFPLSLLLLLALLTFWLERTVREDEVHPSLRRHDPDFVVHDFSIVRYGIGGSVESTLSARKMLHYPDDGSTDLEAPRVQQTKSGEAPMTLTADRGALSQDGEDAFLYDNVLLVRQATPAQREMRMQTSFLHIVRERSLVRTDREVTVRENGSLLTGRGLEYDNGLRQLHIHDKVRGRFEPRKRK